MTLRAIMQAGPAKANELFVKLFDTSEGVVKTREKLFAELKTELELHASLEEQHLFPVLRRNAETKELVVDAVKDNKELRAKLAELEGRAEERRELLRTAQRSAKDISSACPGRKARIAAGGATGAERRAGPRGRREDRGRRCRGRAGPNNQ